MEVLISKALIDSVICHDKFFLINNVLKNIAKWKTKSRINQVYQRFYFIYKTILSYCLKCKKNTESKDPKVARTRNGRIILLLNVQCGIVKNQNLSKSKKLVNY